ncbi:hypothetical protein B0H13DRAFT_1903053 [Mycena leptocephala]|nr:hypothetical protein B0H13DRAFT_1903053 [Mycena leptocephala]
MRHRVQDMGGPRPEWCQRLNNPGYGPKEEPWAVPWTVVPERAALSDTAPAQRSKVFDDLNDDYLCPRDIRPQGWWQILTLHASNLNLFAGSCPPFVAGHNKQSINSSDGAEPRENWIDGLQTVSAPQKHIYFDSIDGKDSKLMLCGKSNTVAPTLSLAPGCFEIPIAIGRPSSARGFNDCTHPSSVQFRFLFLKDLFAVGLDGDFPLKMRIEFFGGANGCLGFFNIFVYLGFKRGLPLARAQPDLR